MKAFSSNRIKTDNVDLISISVSNIFILDYIKILPKSALSPSYWGGRRIISEFLRDPVIGKKRYLGGRFSAGRWGETRLSNHYVVGNMKYVSELKGIGIFRTKMYDWCIFKGNKSLEIDEKVVFQQGSLRIFEDLQHLLPRFSQHAWQGDQHHPAFARTHLQVPKTRGAVVGCWWRFVMDHQQLWPTDWKGLPTWRFRERFSSDISFSSDCNLILVHFDIPNNVRLCMLEATFETVDCWQLIFVRIFSKQVISILLSPGSIPRCSQQFQNF